MEFVFIYLESTPRRNYVEPRLDFALHCCVKGTVCEKICFIVVLDREAAQTAHPYAQSDLFLCCFPNKNIPKIS